MSPIVNLILIYDSLAPNAQQIIQVMKNIG